MMWPYPMAWRDWMLEEWRREQLDRRYAEIMEDEMRRFYDRESLMDAGIL